MLLPATRQEEAGVAGRNRKKQGETESDLFSQRLSTECQWNITQYQRIQRVGEKDVPNGTPYLEMDGPSTLMHDLERLVSNNRLRFLDALSLLIACQADDGS
jgi:hypothetical protein